MGSGTCRVIRFIVLEEVRFFKGYFLMHFKWAPNGKIASANVETLAMSRDSHYIRNVYLLFKTIFRYALGTFFATFL